jgi:NMD protein affecting ribosome stability and mRNA decay
MLKKCPICELNYIRGTETMCRVCAAERTKRHAPKAENEIIMCSECGENPALPGHDLCEEGLKEQKRQANLEVLADKIRADEAEDPLEEDLSDQDGDDE